MKSSRRAKYSRNLHASKLRLAFYPSSFAKKFMLVIVLILMSIVLITTICSFIFSKENQIKHQITEAASSYYENYFYESIFSAESVKTTDEAYASLEKHHEKGFSAVKLDIILSHGSPYADFLNQNCDTNSTTVKFFPDPPYDNKSYHAEYTYSCNFWESLI